MCYQLILVSERILELWLPINQDSDFLLQGTQDGTPPSSVPGQECSLTCTCQELHSLHLPWASPAGLPQVIKANLH